LPEPSVQTQDKLFLLLSEHSVKSGLVRYEVELAVISHCPWHCL
jgi:hypothetical protein